MNALAFERIRPTRDLPWFEDYAKHNTFCKVYNDGCCYVAVPSSPGLPSKKERSHYRAPMDDLFDQLYLKAMKENVAKRDLQEYILAGLREEYPDKWGLVDYVERKILRVYKNLGARKKRFRRTLLWNSVVSCHRLSISLHR